MILTESELRRFIRDILEEQVLGYTPPPKTYDGSDYDDHQDSDSKSTDNSKSGNDSSENSGYMAYGDLSAPDSTKPSAISNPVDYEQLEAQKQSDQKKRQGDIDRGDAVDDNYLNRVTSRLQKATG
jgi:hypothetical protein